VSSPRGLVLNTVYSRQPVTIRVGKNEFGLDRRFVKPRHNFVSTLNNAPISIPPKASEQYFPVVLLLCCTRWFNLLSLWMKSLSVTIQVKASEQYFPVVLFIMQYKMVQPFESVDEILKCDHSSESF